jgi:hypothetical protein
VSAAKLLCEDAVRRKERKGKERKGKERKFDVGGFLYSVGRAREGAMQS